MYASNRRFSYFPACLLSHCAGQHVGGSWAGLCQCCQLMGLPTHVLCKELGHLMHKNRSSSSRDTFLPVTHSKLNGCKHHQVEPTNSCNTEPAATIASTATDQALNVPGTGCCCSRTVQCSDKAEDFSGRDLCACPARAHRQHTAELQEHPASLALQCPVSASLHGSDASMKIQVRWLAHPISA